MLTKRFLRRYETVGLLAFVVSWMQIRYQLWLKVKILEGHLKYMGGVENDTVSGKWKSNE